MQPVNSLQLRCCRGGEGAADGSLQPLLFLIWFSGSWRIQAITRRREKFFLRTDSLAERCESVWLTGSVKRLHGNSRAGITLRSGCSDVKDATMTASLSWKCFVGSNLYRVRRRTVCPPFLLLLLHYLIYRSRDVFTLRRTHSSPLPPCNEDRQAFMAFPFNGRQE